MIDRYDVARPSTDRRRFLRSAVAMGAALSARAYAAGSDLIRVGLIGCGGRGVGAAQQCVRAAPGVKLVAIADVFLERVQSYRASLAGGGLAASEFDLPPDRCFVGLDAYRKVIDCGVDLVILATPPGFRPGHIRAAIGAGKHVFAEKPVAVDSAGVRAVLEAHDEASRKGLSAVVGFQSRYQAQYREAIGRIHRGDLGRIASASCWSDRGTLWYRERQPGWSDLEWQIRNWIYFTWLSGDIIVEQLSHNLDVINWALRSHPVGATGRGGRIERTDPKYGNVYDQFAIDYEYPGGVRVASHCQQIQGRPFRVAEHIVGAEGSFASERFTIAGARAWQFQGGKPNPYQQQHVEQIRSIRDGRPINDLRQGAESTLTAIMGRMAAYTGESVTWEQALQSPEDLMPPRLAWGPLAVAAVATPGRRVPKPDSSRGEKYAFLVGVRTYDKTEELGNLRYSEKDVDALAAVLRASGYRTENVVLMTQTKGADDPRYFPMAAQVRQELRLLLKGLGEEDRVVVAFAGHGVQFKGNPEIYFCPVGARLRDKTTLISLSEVYRELGNCRAGFKLLLADSCRNDPQMSIARSRSVVQLESVTRPRAVPPGGTAALFSCSEGEIAFEHEGLGHGVFFNFVIKGMQGEADLDRDGVVTLPELETYVKKRVFDFVRAEYGREQVPDLLGQVRGLMPLVTLGTP